MDTIQIDFDSSDSKEITENLYLTEEFVYLKDSIQYIKDLNIQTFFHKSFENYLLNYDDYNKILPYLNDLLSYIDDNYLDISSEEVNNILYGIHNTNNLEKDDINDHKKLISYIIEIIMNNIPYIHLKHILQETSNLTEAYEIINGDDLRDKLLKSINDKISTIEKFDNMLKKTGTGIKNEKKQKEYFDILNLLEKNSNKHIEIHYYTRTVIYNTSIENLQNLCKRYLENDHFNIA